MRRITDGWRGAVLGTLVVLGGAATAAVTLWARRSGDWELARSGAIASLVFVLLMLVFVVPPLARSARLEAARLDLPVQLTGGGLIFLSVLALVAFAAWNTGNNLLFLIFSLMTSAVFVGWSAGRASLRDLVVTARFPDHIFAGEPAPAIVTVQNVKRRLPSVSVLVEARSRLDSPAPPRRLRALGFRRARFEKRALGYFMYVPRSSRAEQMVEQTFARRGHVLVTGFELSTGFPFGFFRLRRRLRARDVEIVVYPKPRPASDELHLLPINAGRMASARRGAGQDLHSLRDYQPHDDVRHIDWKATARASRLTVREFAAEDERRVHVVLDTLVGETPRSAQEDKVGVLGRRGRARAGARGRGVAAGAPGGAAQPAAGGTAQPAGGVVVAQSAAADAAERFERGVTLAASLVAHFVEERAEVRLTLGGEGGAYGTGREHMYACLRRLALVAPDLGTQAAAGRGDFWEAITPEPAAAANSYVILLTAAPPGSIPAQVWRASHVIYL